MSIKAYDLDADTVTQICADCGGEHVHDLSAVLKVGVDEGPIGKNTNIIPLPPCATCASQEFIIRTFEVPKAGQEADYAHRFAVNVIHKHQRDSSRVKASLAAEIAAENKPAPGEVPAQRAVSRVDPEPPSAEAKTGGKVLPKDRGGPPP